MQTCHKYVGSANKTQLCAEILWRNRAVELHYQCRNLMSVCQTAV